MQGNDPGSDIGARRAADGPRILRDDDLADYSVVKGLLPVEEEAVVQVAPGSSNTSVELVALRDVALFHGIQTVESVGVTVMRPNYTALVIPRCWRGGLWVNGEPASASRAHLSSKDRCIFIRGGVRDILGIAVRSDLLTETVAALEGCQPDEVHLGGATLDFSPGAARRLGDRLAAVTHEGVSNAQAEAAEELERAALAVIVELFLQGRCDASRGPGWVAPSEIVRLAEERFLDDVGAKLSLADLCVAARVGKTTLYAAFHHLYGMSPLAYFHKRRLGVARRSLLAMTDERGCVKQAAYRAGLTELGRFSVEYRRLYGESPSVTLRRPIG